MTATVRITCPQCGDVVTTPDRVVITHTWAGDITWRAACQHCRHGIARPCTPAAAGLLVAAGAHIGAHIARPAELDDRDRRGRRPIHPAEAARALQAFADASRVDAALANLHDQGWRR